MQDVEAAAVALLSELVGIDSVNPGLVPGAAGEADIVDHLRRDCSVLGSSSRWSRLAAARAVPAWWRWHPGPSSGPRSS